MEASAWEAVTTNGASRGGGRVSLLGRASTGVEVVPTGLVEACSGCQPSGAS